MIRLEIKEIIENLVGTQDTYHDIFYRHRLKYIYAYI